MPHLPDLLKPRESCQERLVWWQSESPIPRDPSGSLLDAAAPSFFHAHGGSEWIGNGHTIPPLHRDTTRTSSILSMRIIVALALGLQCAAAPVRPAGQNRRPHPPTVFPPFLGCGFETRKLIGCFVPNYCFPPAVTLVSSSQNSPSEEGWFW